MKDTYDNIIKISPIMFGSPSLQTKGRLQINSSK